MFSLFCCFPKSQQNRDDVQVHSTVTTSNNLDGKQPGIQPKPLSTSSPANYLEPETQLQQLIPLSDATSKINDLLGLLSLPPSLTRDNLDRTLKKLTSWPTKICTEDHTSYAQLVIPTLFHYFHAVYAVDIQERRIDLEFFKSAQEQPSFHIVSTIRSCIPPAYRPEPIAEHAHEQHASKPHAWIFYHLCILQTLQVLLSPDPELALSFDSPTHDAIAVDLSDVLLTAAHAMVKFPSLAYSEDMAEVRRAMRILEAHVGSLPDDARSRVTKNIENAKRYVWFSPDDIDAESPE